MMITRVEIKEHVFSEEAGEHRATLILEMANNRVSLSASATGDRALTHREILQRLISDALRQLNRLPEYRNLTGQIVLAPGAFPA